ncbi:MAG: hypothetical protein JWP13_606 [Candidatus Saccharibacteria bacterium]|nr:hypothetical protein [Candidatus Saccharibacteria bacterium]
MGFMDKVNGVKKKADESQLDDRAMDELKKMRNKRKNEQGDQG